MSDLRTAAQQALEALEYDNPAGRSATIRALRAALAQQDQPQGCATEEECTYQPWCRIRGTCQRKQADPDISRCPRCGSAADNGHDRELPPNPYFCSRCMAQQTEPVEPVAWSGYDLDGMVEAFSRVIEAHYQRANPFQNPIDMDAQMALRILRGFIPAMKAYAVPPQRKLLTEEEIKTAFHAARNAKLGASQDNSRHRLSVIEIARAVEKASWEKNHGQA